MGIPERPTFGIGSTVGQVLEAQGEPFAICQAPMELAYAINGKKEMQVKANVLGWVLVYCNPGVIVWFDQAGRVVGWKSDSDPAVAVNEERSYDVHEGVHAVTVLGIFGEPDSIERIECGFAFHYEPNGARPERLVTFDADARVVGVTTPAAA